MLSRAVHSLRRSPAYAATIVLTLALGLGAVGAMFALLHGVLLAPLPYAQPERLVAIDLAVSDGSRIGHPPAALAIYRRHATQVEDVALYRIGRANVAAGPDAGDAENLAVSWISASTMAVLGVAPVLGRTFTEDETRRTGPQAVILGDAEWRARFGAAPDVIGRTLVVNDVAREIVGVMPAGFAFPTADTRMWLPAKAAGDDVATDFFYTGVARLAAGATAASLQQELAALWPRLAEPFPRLGSGGSTAAWVDEMKPAPRVRGLREALTGAVAPTLWLFGGLAALVLLVASANVANLALIRADAGRRDSAVREALGARPLQAVAPWIGEAIVLGSMAVALAVLAAAAALWALRAFGPADFPRLAELSIGPWSVGFIAAIAAAGGALGVWLRLRLEPPDALARRLGDGAHGQTAGRSRQRLRTGAAVVQVAAALVVLAGAALLLRTAQRLHAVDPGFAPDRVTTFQILLPFARYDETARVAFHARLVERVRALPSVQAAGLTAQLPLAPTGAPTQSFRVEGEAQPRTLAVGVIGDGYLAAMRIPLLAGRDFRLLEAQRPDELLVNRRAARELFDDPTGVGAIGRRLLLEPGGPAYTVVGVVGDVHEDDLATPPAARVYRPQVVAARPGVDPGPLPGMVLVVRADGAPESLAAAVRGIVRALDAGVPLFQVRPLAEVVRQSMARLRLMASVTSAAAVVTLALGMVGLYGVMAYAVALRRREFGLRLALGADAPGIAAMVLRRGLALAAVGIAVGLAGFALAAAALRATVAGFEPWDPLPLGAAAVLLLAISGVASWLPARRAAAVDPVQALRAD